MKDPHDIIIRPVLSEKSYDEMPDKRYTFIVDPRANKTEIKKAVEVIFGVKVQSVNTLRQLGKLKRVGAHTGRKPSFKKAYVKLTAESKEIEFFEGMAQ
ncbi:MAG TPA: 50S ribosomal protein L23 [Clostridiales bacterium]|nr:50S ribosomal protein L23 [Clostridia bacterium]MDD4679312.1 50S ribosomal protein L23 [Clostridia bacterium]HCS74716.1 50S ribosomal protein L23 [Clostridiales bacterium]